jgi:hypothetical protein
VTVPIRRLIFGAEDETYLSLFESPKLMLSSASAKAMVIAQVNSQFDVARGV